MIIKRWSRTVKSKQNSYINMRHHQSSMLGHLLDKEIEFWLQGLCCWSTISSKFNEPAYMMENLFQGSQQKKLSIRRTRRILQQPKERLF